MNTFLECVGPWRLLGALTGGGEGGGPISYIDFKQWQCPLSLFLQCPCQVYNRLSQDFC